MRKGFLLWRIFKFSVLEGSKFSPLLFSNKTFQIGETRSLRPETLLTHRSQFSTLLFKFKVNHWRIT